MSLEPYRNFLGIAAAIAGILSFDLAAPVESWVKVVFSAGLIMAIILMFFWQRRKAKTEKESQFVFPSGSLRDENQTFTNEQLKTIRGRWWHCKGYNYVDK